ncbi:MAG: GMC family oxidoreductase N-terminal domain-containing protein [Pseudomonadota bacterium]|nr:GMC family oxidoreductase N-terminal domain-containing protein [Pseudomonadota bacterium]
MEEFDYIVVGAGSAGCVLANRLSASPGNRVLLLEAGGPDNRLAMRMPLAMMSLVLDPTVNWPFETQPEPHCNNRRMPIPRGRVLGGSSTINAMLYARGHPGDYDEWRDMGLPGWGYADVLPYFKRSESFWAGASHYHGGDGEMAVSPVERTAAFYELFAEAARQAGFPRSDDHNGARPEGISPTQVTIDRGRRASSARAFIHPVRSRSNLTVRTGALVHRIEVKGGAAEAVVYEQRDALHTVRALREVVLCGGTYNSAQLLLLSGIGPADELRAVGVTPVADSPEVGKNLQEHVNAVVTARLTQPLSLDPMLRFDRMVGSVLRWLFTGRGAAASMPFGALGFIRTQPDSERPDVELIPSPIGPEARLWFPGLRKPLGHQISCRVAVLHPRSRGEVTLQSADPKAAPRIAWNLLAVPRDLQTLRDGVRAVRSIYRQAPLRDAVGGEVTPGDDVVSDARLDDWLRQNCWTAAHPAGTCRMGSDPRAVVDGNLRVNGVARLRVADCSIMPRVTGCNTNAPSIMIGEKAADLLLGREPLPPVTG